ncbi:type II secretion system F family protein [Agromyces mangrovi Wang et al. 2018]|uniref:type II secretion system F family protein n=1 Tax=Agromyces mangrovi TaxID=1858653 RepID=UPI0025744EAE|nr:type II secretion system F family protein [Agromyces mangrovi]BDZ65042.1 TadB protein [Agromyces mangrovi]
MSAVYVLGLLAALFALLALVVFVIAPPAPRVALDRRLAPGTQYESRLTRATNRTVRTIEKTMRRRERGAFGEESLELAGVRMQPSAFVLVTFSISALLAAIGVLIGFGTWWSLVLGLLFACLGPLFARLYLALRVSSRRSKFAEQLDDTMQLLAGNLRAGHGLVQAIDSVARDGDAPTSEEFARVVNQSRIGRDLNDALTDTAERMQSDDFKWAAQAIAINRATGGNLAEVLYGVAATIRERNEIRLKVKSLSAEGRLSATILLILPVAVFLGVLIIQPSYFEPFFTTLFGWIALVVAGVLMIVGVVWMLAAVRVRF